MLGWIFNLLEKRFIKHINEKKNIRLTKENMVFSFFDDQCKGYYEFPKSVDLPICRLGKLQEFMMWMQKGVSQEEYIKALDKAEEALVDVLKSGKNASKIGFVLHELRDRCNMVLHDELFYNVLATQIIRDDEDPTIFNNEIHMQKVAEFKLLDAKSDAFFLDTQKYLEQFGLSNITRAQLQKLLHECRIVREASERMLNSL